MFNLPEGYHFHVHANADSIAQAEAQLRGVDVWLEEARRLDGAQGQLMFAGTLQARICYYRDELKLAISKARMEVPRAQPQH